MTFGYYKWLIDGVVNKNRIILFCYIRKIALR